MWRKARSFSLAVLFSGIALSFATAQPANINPSSLPPDGGALINSQGQTPDESLAPVERLNPTPDRSPERVPQSNVDPTSPSSPPVKSLTGRDLLKAPLAPTLAMRDSEIAENIRGLLATPATGLFERKDEREAVEGFYRDRGFAPLWTEGGRPTTKASSAMTFLKNVATEGLDPGDYPIPNFVGDAAALAAAELRFTHSLLDYARQAQTGRVNFSRISDDISYKQDFPLPSSVLEKLASAADISRALASYNPPHSEYKALKEKLAELRNSTGASSIRIANGPTLLLRKVLMQDSRVPALRSRLGLNAKSDTLYDPQLADAVTTFQRQRGLPVTGDLTASTIEALNAPMKGRNVDTIIANMERWRWMPRDLGKAYSILNVPDFTLKVFSEGKVVWQTKVVVGKPSTPTPIFSDKMKYITVNPTWNVPPSIVNNEYLPALQRNPDALSRMGIKIAQNPDGSIRMYQPPGERNALGRLRFNFPNRYLVYQHDTPDKNLFDRDRRAFSHGCMRVQNPDKYAEIVLSLTGTQKGLTADRLRNLFGGREQQINLATPLPVHITYQTAFVSENGALVIRDDLYGHDAKISSVIKSGETLLAISAGERRTGATRVTGTNRGTERSHAHYSDGSPSGRWFR